MVSLSQMGSFQAWSTVGAIAPPPSWEVDLGNQLSPGRQQGAMGASRWQKG